MEEIFGAILALLVAAVILFFTVGIWMIGVAQFFSWLGVV